METEYYKDTFFVLFIVLFLGNLEFYQNGFATSRTGTLFGINVFDGTLLTINPSSGSKTIVVSESNIGPSLAVDPITGKMYASYFGKLGILYEVNPSTGTLVEVGPLKNAFSVPGLDF